MNKKRKTIAAFLTAALGVALIMGGCGNTKEETVSENYKQVKFPIKEDVTLSIWSENTLNVVKNLKDMGCYKELEKLTGVKVNVLSPVAGQSQEQFNIMIASGEYPDIIESVEQSYKGGLVKAWQDNVILELTDLMKNCAPNLNSIYKKFPQIKMGASDTQGHIFTTPMIRGGNILRTYIGPIVRADYMKKFNLETPKTIDDWHEMLTVFKNNGIEYPFTSAQNYFKNYQVFRGAFGVNHGFFNDNGTIKFGPIEENYKEYVKTMAQWYAEGLIDSEIYTNDQKIADSKIMNSGAGVFIGTCGNSIGGYIQEMKTKNPEFDLMAIPYPVSDKVKVNRFIQRDTTVQTGLGASITTACKHPDIAMAYLDFAYSKEGSMAMNFGIEGESYIMENGYPKYTDIVMKNPDGLPVSKAGSLYARSFTKGPFIQDVRYGEQFYGQPRQLEAGKIWSENVEAVSENDPRIYGILSPERNDEITSSQNEINTYVSEMFAKWFMGKEDIEAGWDEYVNQIKNMGLEKIMKYTQEAQDEFFKKYPDMKHAENREISEELFWNN